MLQLLKNLCSKENLKYLKSLTNNIQTKKDDVIKGVQY